MDSDHQNGFQRQSIHQGVHSRPLDRRPGKKSSSRDRHGIVYPDNFQETGIRTVTPDSYSEAENRSLHSDAEYLTRSGATSPHSATRAVETRREFNNASQFLARGHDDDAVDDNDNDDVDDDDNDDVPADLKSHQPTRPRTTTLEDQRSEKSPNSHVFKARNRQGSVHTAGSNTKSSEDLPLNSIGYPSIHPAPTFLAQSASLHRLSKALHGESAGSGAGHVGLTLPLSNADASKILQLMKQTCGRMHGILSFRAASTTTWTSGYCAINVAAGSLIYQAKGEPALAKTLIPDLRGCRVRTHFDPDTQTNYISVSTFTSGLGIHLRPHVGETFDSWLAALLCWQPIRPKGVQNKMTKPQTVAIGERRLADRRRNSESTVQKDAAIIKVGKMLLWDKPTAVGARPDSARRVSTYRQQRALSSSWRRVSCTLQENGHFKLFTESDVTLVTCVQLSRLSRCAVQQLEPSVLEDEFCIAVYPQYTAQSYSDSSARPIYLALESRVLFEVWFVLLRAFTIPELYGPATPADDRLSPSLSASQSSLASLPSDMFRIERLLTVRITEAKISRGKEDAMRMRKPSRSHGLIPPASSSSSAHDYYTEVLLDGEVRARTAVKHRTSNPFWREDFTFYDLPPILSQVSFLVKTLHPTQKDWSLFAPGSYNSTQDGHSILEELEVSSHDSTSGRVDLRLDDLEPGVEVEKWWPILDDEDQPMGELFMKARMEETIVLMSHEYEPMSELLHTFTNNLTINMAHILTTDLNQLAETLLNIYQVSGQAVEWMSALVEDEIDGLHKESTASRLRYTTRIHSNDSKGSSGEDREVLVRDLGRTATVEANLLFRGNSLLTKALDLHMRRLGNQYLEETIGERLRDIDDSEPECEVDPGRIQRHDDLERNWRNLITLTTGIWKAIAASASRCPPELRLIFRHIRACAEDRYGDFLRTVTYSSVSGFLFLRFFCPAILNPKLFGLLKDHPRLRAQRTFTLIAKALQGLANMSTFGNKEPWMEPMNKFLLSNRSEFKQFVDAICAIPADRPMPIVSPSYATPIQILGRLPPTSREGFPSLPFLIDHARSFANLTDIWLEGASAKMAELDGVDVTVRRFHEMALALKNRTRDCLSQAEQAERPSGNLEVKWEELVDSMERSATFYDESSSKPTTPGATNTTVPAPLATETMMPGSASIASHRNSIGYFSPRPSVTRRSTDVDHDGGGADDEAPPSASSSTWEQSRVPFSIPKWSDAKDSTGTGTGTGSSKNSSTYSLENFESAKAARRASVTRDTGGSGGGSGGKLRFLDFVPAGARRKNRDRDRNQSQQHSREELRNEFS